MSEMVHYTGELIEIPKTESVEVMCKQICQESGMGEKSADQTWKERFEEEFYEDYVINNDVIYKVEIIMDNPYEIYLASKNSNGRIKFEVKYCSGDCDLGEALEKAIKKM